MAEVVSYAQDGEVAVLTMDDGKANALAAAMSEGLNAGLDRAAADAKAVVIRGREGVLCGGFDLKVIRGDDESARIRMRDLGYALLQRLYLSPQPIVFACTGHAVAAGALLLCAGDVRIGKTGDFKIGLNETAIGLALPIVGLEIARDRIAPAYLSAAAIMATLYDPEEAAKVGYLDDTAAPEDLDETAMATARRLAALDPDAFAETKRRLRQPTIDRITKATA